MFCALAVFDSYINSHFLQHERKLETTYISLSYFSCCSLGKLLVEVDDDDDVEDDEDDGDNEDGIDADGDRRVGTVSDGIGERS